MKTIILTITCATLLIVSCKKGYSCNCTSTNTSYIDGNPDSTLVITATQVKELGHANRKNAQKQCDSYKDSQQALHNLNGFGNANNVYMIECDLKEN